MITSLRDLALHRNTLERQSVFIVIHKDYALTECEFTKHRNESHPVMSGRPPDEVTYADGHDLGNQLQPALSPWPCMVNPLILLSIPSVWRF